MKQIVADSINEHGDRLTTYVLEYPRFVHSELMTHRVFSKNAASSRAIPIEKMIQQVIDNPAMPVFWGKNQSGMQAREELDNSTSIYRSELDRHFTDLEYAKYMWLFARDSAICSARQMHKIGLHKQTCNRVLEPFFNIRVILSGTDFQNFFALRAHPDAQPEFKVLAELMLEEYNKSTPKKLSTGEWHIPFGDAIDNNRLLALLESKYRGFNPANDNEDREVFEDARRKIAVARCARVSYFNFEGKDDYAKDIETCDKLFGSVPRHLSPAEHVAQAQSESAYIGNFRGFKQLRKFYSDENLKDERVKTWK